MIELSCTKYGNITLSVLLIQFIVKTIDLASGHAQMPNHFINVKRSSQGTVPRFSSRGQTDCVSPPRLGGGMFVNFSVWNNVCQLCQGTAKYAMTIDILYQKHITRGDVCEFWGPHQVDKHTFLDFVYFVSHIRVGLPGPLRTAFELKSALPTAKNQPDATAPTGNAINCLNLPKNINNFVRKSQKMKK